MAYVRAWAALRASSVEGRFEALHTTGLTALIGREEEFELLLRPLVESKEPERRHSMAQPNRRTSQWCQSILGQPTTISEKAIK
jgi:hypothetical protein